MPTIQQDFVTKWDFVPSVQKDYSIQFDVYNKIAAKSIQVDFGFYIKIKNTLNSSFDIYKKVQNTLNSTFDVYNIVPNIRFETRWKIIPGLLKKFIIPFNTYNYTQGRINVLFEIERGNYIASSLEADFTTYSGASRSLTIEYNTYIRSVSNSLIEQFAVHAGVTNSLDVLYGISPERKDLGSNHIPMISPNRIYIV